MFGYIRIDKPELKVREYEAYKSAYCGLCRAMGKCTGCASRVTLSYDFAFLLVLRTVLTGTKYETVYARCPAHPTQKKPMMAPNAESEYVACAAALLFYYKCKDDLSDEQGGKKLRARTLLPTAARMRKKALKKNASLAALDEKIRLWMETLAAEEAKRIPSADHYAALFGQLLGEIFSFGLPEAEARIARAVGRAVGKWIYLVDAYDDLSEDRTRGRFNPYLLLWEETAQAKHTGREDTAGDSAKKSDPQRETLRVALLCELTEAENAMDLLNFYEYPDFDGVLKNILYRGMPRTAEEILCGKNKKKTHGKDRQKGNE